MLILTILFSLLAITAAFPTDTTTRDAAPSLNELLTTPMTFEKRQSNTTSLPSATVQLCTQPSFAGECTNATWPVNQCIDLRGYAGVTESVSVGDGFECLFLQGKCDATKPFVEVGDSGDDAAEGNNLTTYDWIEDLTSYICFTEIESLQRFVRVSRLRVKGVSA